MCTSKTSPHNSFCVHSQLFHYLRLRARTLLACPLFAYCTQSHLACFDRTPFVFCAHENSLEKSTWNALKRIEMKKNFFCPMIWYVQSASGEAQPYLPMIIPGSQEVSMSSFMPIGPILCIRILSWITLSGFDLCAYENFLWPNKRRYITSSFLQS